MIENTYLSGTRTKVFTMTFVFMSLFIPFLNLIGVGLISNIKGESFPKDFVKWQIVFSALQVFCLGLLIYSKIEHLPYNFSYFSFLGMIGIYVVNLLFSMNFLFFRKWRLIRKIKVRSWTSSPFFVENVLNTYNLAAIIETYLKVTKKRERPHLFLWKQRIFIVPMVFL